MNKIERHKQICDSLNEMYIKKNHDYGDSVHDTYEKYGITSFLVRMEDKLNRARTLSQKEAKVEDEKLTDTLLDLANYAILAALELEEDKYMSDFIGKKVRNTKSGEIGIILRINESGSIQVLERICPKVINTHNSFKTLEFID